MAGFISGNATLSSGSVSTAALADNAVTLAKMAGGTDGNLIGIDASGDPAYIATGSDGEVLTSGGSGVAAVMEAAAAGGAWNLIGTSVASTSASLTITGLDSTYDTFAVALQDMRTATGNVTAYIRFGDSSGIDSGGSDYVYHSRSLTQSGGAIDRASTGAGYIEICGGANDVGNDAGEGAGWMLYISAPGDGTTWSMIHGTGSAIDDSTIFNTFLVGGSRAAVITLDRVQFLFSSGNIASGRMTVWGIAHA